MKTLALFLITLIAFAAGLLVYVRLAPSDPARWHIDPLALPDPASPNFARADELIAAPAETVAARLAAVAQAEGAVRLAGDDRFATWVSRSRWMGFPDYTTIRLEPAEGGTRLIALARARFGYSDLGVNRARLERWIAAARAG